jgi:hypothetical protein
LHSLAIMGYCLMSNHVHLITIPGKVDILGRAQKDTHGRYASHWNGVHRVASSLDCSQLADISGHGENRMDRVSSVYSHRPASRSTGVPWLARTQDALQPGPAEARTTHKDHRREKTGHADVRSVASYQVVTQTDTFALGPVPSGPAFPIDPHCAHRARLDCCPYSH